MWWWRAWRCIRLFWIEDAQQRSERTSACSLGTLPRPFQAVPESGNAARVHSTWSNERMNAEEIRALQAPLKEQYRQQADTALVTLRAEGRIGEGITCKLETGKGLVA